MKSFQRLASAARGTLWLLRATGLRDHVAKLDKRMNALDTQVVHVAAQSTSALRLADNLQRLEKQIHDVMADVTSQHATTVRVAENVQRLGKHIVDVAANNLTNGRLSDQLQKLEKHVSEIGAGHLANGKLADQFQKLERHISEVTATGLVNGKLAEQFRRLESALAGSQNYDKLKEPLQKLEKHVADLTAAHSGLAEQLRDLHKHLESHAASEATAKRLRRIEQRLDQVCQLLEREAAAPATAEERPSSACKDADLGGFTLCVATVSRSNRRLAA
jgi:septation ring formation regulator EzrA